MLIKQQKSLKSRGFTLTEAAIVLGIVGLILSAIWVAAGAVYSNMRTQNAGEQIIKIVANVRSLYANQNTMENADFTLAAIRAGVFPRDMVNAAGNAIVNVWGGGGTLVGATDRFTLNLTNIPRASCNQLVMRVAGPGRDTGLITYTGAAVGNVFPATVSTADAACGAADPVPNLAFTLMLQAG